MSDFINPICVNILSLNNTIKNRFIFVGNVPENVKKELEKIEKTNKYHESSILTKYYGKGWKKIIKLDLKSGGDDFSFEDEYEEESDDENVLSQDYSFLNMEEMKEDIVKRKDLTGGVNFIFDISVFAEDNAMEFKQKIYASTGIPIYRQHVWFNDKISYPVYYKIYAYNNPINISMEQILTNYENLHKIESIPVKQDYYKKKNFLKVVADDTFITLGEIYNKHGITEYNIIDLEEFIKDNTFLKNILKDTYQLELIYYGFVIIYYPIITLEVFKEYIINESNISKIYPLIKEDVSQLTKKLKLEKNIILEKHIEAERKLVKKSITKNITKITVNIIKYFKSTEVILLIRNLFDKFQLDDTIPICICDTEHNGKNVTLYKTYKNYKINNFKTPRNSISFKIIDINYNFKLTLLENGNYSIESSWNEKNQYGFDDIFNICKKKVTPFINKINTLGNYILKFGQKLPEISRSNYYISDISMALIYKNRINKPQFKFLQAILDEYSKAGILKIKLVENNFSEYYFSKGMFEFKKEQFERLINIENYYSHLSDGVVLQKWNTIFEKTRITKVFHRESDVKIFINNISEKEFITFYEYIITLFQLYERNSSNIKEIDEKSIKKSLKSLKEQDPELYIFKGKATYSKTCQKPHQPVLLSKKSYEALSNKDKKNAVKFKNFTNNQEIYYTCPGSKYPNINFIAGKHPKGYCIPCCKKMEISERTNEAKRAIQEICKTKYEYHKEVGIGIKTSKYIMTYGKDVEPGRLCKLPESSIGSMFYETSSAEGKDPECETNRGYYIYGVEQNIASVRAGILNILSISLEKNVEELINYMIKLLKEESYKYRLLLNGSIHNHFVNIEDFIDNLKQFGDVLFTSEIDWNSIFISFSFLFMRINIIYFTHIENNPVKLIIPSYIKNKEQYISKEYRNIIILQKDDKYYPIYYIDLDMFYSTKIIFKKVFTIDDYIINIMSKISSISFKESKNSKNITYEIIKEFAQENEYKIVKLFVNSINMIYYIQLSKSKKSIYIPIDMTMFVSGPVTYEVFLYKNKNNIADIIKFTKEYNKWVINKSLLEGSIINDKLPLKESIEPIYPYINIERWLVVSKSKITDKCDVIGFVSNNINYYVDGINVGDAIKIKKVPIERVLYEIDTINKNIHNNTKSIIDRRCKLLGKSLYDANIYKLLLLEFITLFNKDRDYSLRTKLKKNISNYVNKDFNKLNKFLIDNLSDEDYYKIRTQLMNYNEYGIKSKLFDIIDSSYYDFDKKLYQYLKTLNHTKLVTELEKISKKIIVFGNVNNIKKFDFPNMFISCQDNNAKYCNKKKLILDKKHKGLLDVLAMDILNPLKEKWIFSTVFLDNTINFFKFTKYPYENIVIEME